MARERQQDTEILEQGNIYFCYTPKVERDSVAELDDVQQFNIVLAPHGKQSYRLIVVGQKRLANVEDNNNCWCFVESVSDNAKEIEQGLRQETYQTKTLGERNQPAARSVGNFTPLLLKLPKFNYFQTEC